MYKSDSIFEVLVLKSPLDSFLSVMHILIITDMPPEEIVSNAQ
jgi:hypothetical protein